MDLSGSPEAFLIATRWGLMFGWVMCRWSLLFTMTRVNSKLRQGTIYGCSALLALGASALSIPLQEWITCGVYALMAAVDANQWWNDDETKRRRKKLWDKVKRRVTMTGTGRLGVSEA